MTSEQLQYFLITAKHLNFSAAAKELYVSQPAVSHQISMLEKELGARLFNRSTRKIQLSRSGELFLEDAKRILDMISDAKNRVSLADTEDEQTLTICYLMSPCHGFLPKLCNRMKTQYPQVRLNLVRMFASGLDRAMQEKEADLFFSMSRDLINHPEYGKKDLFTDTFCLICPPEHPIASLTALDYDKLASEQFLIMDPEHAPYINKQIHQLCRSINFVPQRIRNCASFEEILFEVESGLGVSILPLKSIENTSDSLVRIPLPGTLATINMGVSWQLNAENPAIHWFLDLLDQSKSEHPEWF